MNDYIVWDEENKQIIDIKRQIEEGDTHKILHRKFCIRLNKGDKHDKYGMWSRYEESSGSCTNWVNIEWEQFPKEFKTALLLQGIDHESL